MMTEKGTLPVGVEFEGKLHKDFEIRPQLVRDSVEVAAMDLLYDNSSYFGTCILAKQLVKLGEIPKEKITPALLMDMYETDAQKLAQARQALESRLCRFCPEEKSSEKNNSGNDAAGV